MTQDLGGRSRSRLYQGLAPGQEIGALILGLMSFVTVPGVPPFVVAANLFVAFGALVSRPVEVIRRVAVPMAFAALSLFAAFVAATVHRTAFLQRGTFVLCAFILAFVAYSGWTRGNLNKAAAIMTGVSTVFIFLGVFRPSEFAATDIFGLWKFAIAVPVTVVILYALNRSKERTMLSVIVLAVLGFASMSLNFRSHAICCMVAALVIFVRFGPHRVLIPFARNTLNIVFIVAGAGGMYILPKLVKEGLFGAEVAKKTIEQADEGPLFLAGRTEPPMSFSIIQDSPWVGFGDMHRVPDTLIERGVNYARSLGMTNLDVIYQGWYRGGETVTLHSILAQYWVETGLFGCLMVFYAFGLALVVVFRAPQMRSTLITYLALQLLWDSLFSAYTNYTIILWSILIPTMHWALRYAKSEKRAAAQSVRPGAADVGSTAVAKPPGLHPEHYSNFMTA